MPAGKPVAGLYAAVLAPRDANGVFDERAFRSLVEFLLGKRVNRVVLNGATGEYCVNSPDDLRRMLAICRDVLGSSGEFLAGIGAAGLHRTLALAEVAQEFGPKALLLPMPHFFPYEQTDLAAWCEDVACRVNTPVLLYNLPRFTTPLAASTAVDLIRSVPNIAGIKDSSGNLEILTALTHNSESACRIVGDDSVLVEALRQSVCDGVISGVAGVLPELMLYLWHRRAALHTVEYGHAAERLAELCDRLSALPVPWALKWLAEARGIAPAVFAQPVSGGRQAQSAELVHWFGEWWASTINGMAA